MDYGVQELFVVNNTIVSDFRKGSFLSIAGKPAAVSVINNIFFGQGVELSVTGAIHHNLVLSDPHFQNRSTFDYRLRPDSPAIDGGVSPGVAADFELAPQFQYLHPAQHEPRNTFGPMDLGALEYIGQK
jgi:hypothetical protein